MVFLAISPVMLSKVAEGVMWQKSHQYQIKIAVFSPRLVVPSNTRGTGLPAQDFGFNVSGLI